MSKAKRDVLLAWQLSDTFGWGIAGLNIFMDWTFSGGPRPSMLFPIQPDHISGVDPLRRSLLAADFARSNINAQNIQDKLKQGGVNLDCTVVHSLGNNFNGTAANIRGNRNFGRIVFEFPMAKEAIARAKNYDALIVASRWNQEYLQSITDVPVYLNHEAVDTSLFYPSQPSGFLPQDNFYVFSGGKPEPRKGQDIVLLAFKKFAQNKPNVKLVTAWHSPWINLSAGMKGRLEHPLGVKERALDIVGWAVANGIDSNKIIDVGRIPNSQAARVMREMDCALQLSRCEGGTNFVAMEALACGIPTILSSGTGHEDIRDMKGVMLIGPEPSKSLKDAPDHWVEPNLDDAVSALEMLYATKQQSRISVRNSEKFKWDWVDHSIRLEKILSP
jgi:glycosyltransferase involved in cell wall biosynthesis